MALNAKKVEKPKGKVASLLPIDTYPSRLLQVIDLGLQARSAYKGEDKVPVNQIWTTYELPTELLEDDDGNPDPEKPRWISEKLNLFHPDQEKAKSTIRMDALDPTSAYGYDWSLALGSPVAVTVVHKTSNGKTYANIGGTGPLMKGMVVPELVNEPVFFDLEEPNMEVYEGLPDFLKEIIVANLNFKGSKLEAFINGAVDNEADDDEDESVDDEDRPY